MSQSHSVGSMVAKLSGLLGTKDITEWESEFIESVGARTRNGKDTSGLSDKQVDVVVRIHDKHFG